MENVRRVVCTWVNWCSVCSRIRLPQASRITNVVQTCSYRIPNKLPVYSSANGSLVGKQTACCDGYVDIYYIPVSESTTTTLTTYRETTREKKTMKPSLVTESTTAQSIMASTTLKDVTRDHTATFYLTPSATMLTILGSVALFFILLAFLCFLVRCKRKSTKMVNDKNFYDDTTSSDEAAEYSTIEETKELMNALTTSKTISKGIPLSDNYFVLEKTCIPHNKIYHLQTADVDVMHNRESNIYNTVERVDNNLYKGDYTTESDIYNTLNEHRKQVQIDEDSCYSHFSDFDDNIYSHTIRSK